MKAYAIKLSNGSAHTQQRSWSSGDWFACIYKTLSGAEKSALKVNGGVYTIYINDNYNKSTDLYDDEINHQLRKLGFNV